MLKALGTILGTAVGNKKGLVSIISEKTGKISFKRSASIIVLTTIVAPDVVKNELTWMNVAVIGLCLIAPTLTDIFKKA